MRLHTFLVAACAIVLTISCKRNETADSIESETPAESAASTSTNTSVAQRYPAKSGIIVSRVTGMIDEEITVYFDDGGAREATYTTSVIKVANRAIKKTSIEIRDGDWLYSYKEDKDHWVRSNVKTLGSAPATPGGSAIPTTSVMTDMMKGATTAKELPPRTIAGKEAKGMEMEMMGMKIRTWMWENITLRSEVETGPEPMITEVTSLQLGVPVPADKLRPPPNATIIDRN